MPEKSSEAAEPMLYEYSVVRFLPRVEREEFINVGLVMMCKRCRWLRARVHIDEALLSLLAPGCDAAALHNQLDSFTAVAAGAADSPIASLEAHERFRWLTAVRSACIATSRPHPGLSDDLDATFERLFSELVLR